MFISLPFGVPDMFLGYSFFVGDCFFLGLYSLGIPVLFGVALLPLSHKRNETAYNTRSEDLSHCCQLFVEPVGFFSTASLACLSYLFPSCIYSLGEKHCFPGLWLVTLLFEELVFSGAPLFHSLRPWNGNIEETQLMRLPARRSKVRMPRAIIPPVLAWTKTQKQLSMVERTSGYNQETWV